MEGPSKTVEPFMGHHGAGLTGRGSGFASGRSVSSVGVSLRLESTEPLETKGNYIIVTIVLHITTCENMMPN